MHLTGDIRRNIAYTTNARITRNQIEPTGPESQLVQHGILSHKEVSRMQKAGVIGDVLSHTFNQKGEEVPSSLSERLIGLSIEDLGKLKKCILVAGGEEKRECVLAALKGKWVDLLITDEKTASWLIQIDKERGSDGR